MEYPELVFDVSPQQFKKKKGCGPIGLANTAYLEDVIERRKKFYDRLKGILSKICQVEVFTNYEFVLFAEPCPGEGAPKFLYSSVEDPRELLKKAEAELQVASRLVRPESNTKDISKLLAKNLEPSVLVLSQDLHTVHKKVAKNESIDNSPLEIFPQVGYKWRSPLFASPVYVE